MLERTPKCGGYSGLRSEFEILLENMKGFDMIGAKLSESGTLAREEDKSSRSRIRIAICVNDHFLAMEDFKSSVHHQ